MSRFVSGVPGVSFGSFHLTDLEYLTTPSCSARLTASWETLWAYTVKRLKSLASRWAGWKPSSCMSVTDRIHLLLRFGNDIVEPVKNFVYLGSIVTDNGDLKPEITRRRAWLRQPPVSLETTLAAPDHLTQDEAPIYNSAVLSILL